MKLVERVITYHALDDTTDVVYRMLVGYYNEDNQLIIHGKQSTYNDNRVLREWNMRHNLKCGYEFSNQIVKPNQQFYLI